MLTIFSIPKPFSGNIRIIQRNAIQSWLSLEPKCEVILFGDEEGTASTANEFGIRHVPNIATNEYGTPLLSEVFECTREMAEHETLMYVNTDIMFLPDLVSAVGKINKALFLMSGRRWDLDVIRELDFGDTAWQETIQEMVLTQGRLHGLSGIDYFVFPRRLPCAFPSFAVGRPGWDNWFIYAVRTMKIPVIDASEAVTAVHQNHISVYSPRDDESTQNFRMAGGFSRMMSLRDANLLMDRKGLKKPEGIRGIYSLMSGYAPVRVLLALKRKINLQFVK